MADKTTRVLRQLKNNIPQNTSFGKFTLPNHSGVKRYVDDREIDFPIAAHAPTHELGGVDQVTHDNLWDIGANNHHAQLHVAEHELGGGDVLTHNNLLINPNDHHAQLHVAEHELGGGDVLTHNNLALGANDHHPQAHLHDGIDGSGQIPHANTTLQTPNDHHPQLHVAEHELGGGDVLTHNNLAIGVNDHHPQLHAANHAALGADPVDHNTLFNYVVNEHIDWTNAVANFLTAGDVTCRNLTLTGGDIDTPAGVNTRIILADAAGVRRFQIMDSNLVGVYSCDSVGNIITYATTTFNVSGGSMVQGVAGVTISGGAGAGNFLRLQSSTLAGADFFSIMDAVGTTCTANTAMGSAHYWQDVNLTTGTCHDTWATAGTSGSGYKITLDSDNAADFRAIHVVSGAGANITVHRVDETGTIQNFTETGLSRWKRRTWKGCNEMDNTVQQVMSTVSWPNAPHYKQLNSTSGYQSIYWSIQIPRDWDGTTDILCTIRFLIDQPGGVAALDQLSWNVSMSCEQPFDRAATASQGANGFYTAGVNNARWTIHEISWVLNHNSIPAPLQAGDHVSFHFYSTTFGDEEEWESVGVIGAWHEYKTTYPEIPVGTT